METPSGIPYNMKNRAHIAMRPAYLRPVPPAFAAVEGRLGVHLPVLLPLV